MQTPQEMQGWILVSPDGVPEKFVQDIDENTRIPQGWIIEPCYLSIDATGTPSIKLIVKH